MARIMIPYAPADFVDLRERGFYYIDKTGFIPKLEDYNAPVFLRPRRFGKSLLVSMLASYYDRTMADRFDELFAGTWIGEHPTEEHNRYMVIRYDFSGMERADDMADLKQNFNDLNCAPVEIMVEHNRDLFGNFQFKTSGNPSKMLEEVLAHIRAYQLPKVYVLVDECDNLTIPVSAFYDNPLLGGATVGGSFVHTFFRVIKKGIGEGSIRTCFYTGTLSGSLVGKEGVFDIGESLSLHPDFVNMLGFTYAEVEKYLHYLLDKYVDSQEDYDEIWKTVMDSYEGYCFELDGVGLFNSTMLTYILDSLQ